MLETPALIAATAVLTPLMLIASYTDLKELRIPNWLVLAVLATAIVTGLWGLPLETFLWRMFYALVTLIVGILLFAFGGGKIGGGDMKLIAALVPFIEPVDIWDLMLLWAILAVVGIMFHRVIYHMYRHQTTGWVAFDQKVYFPVGLLIGLTMCVYLFSRIAVSLNWV